MEFNSFMHCINYQLIIITVDDTASFFHSSSFVATAAAAAAFGAFVRLFVARCVHVCASAFHFTHLLNLLLFYAPCFSSTLLSYEPFYAFVFVLKIVVAMVQNVISRFEKSVANFHWIC